MLRLLQVIQSFTPSGARLLVTSAVVGFFAVTLAPGAERERSGRNQFLRQMPATVRADHPEIVPVADAVRAVSADPLEQVAIVHHVTRLLVEYDSDRRVYGREDYHATLDEMIAVRDREGWAYLRDDCDGRAVFAAHLLAALDLPWRLEASFMKGHAWVSTWVDGQRYDLLDLRESDPELRSLSYRVVGRHVLRRSNPPPEFNWRRAWRERTAGDIAVGLRLGLVELRVSEERYQMRYAVDWTLLRPETDSRHRRGKVAASQP
jgi:hypothetical protein